MNSLRTSYFLWIIVFVFSAFSGFTDYPAVNLVEVDKTDHCKNHPAHTYQVFIPSMEKTCKSMPLMIVTDPHGDGKLAIKLFKEAAQKYGLVLVASNLIQNNVPDYLSLFDELIADVKSKYPIGNTLYLAGFSGGARMSLDYAANRHANGVIACGALAAPEQIKAINCPVFAIVGMDDFNFIEAAQYIINPDNIPQNLFLETITASHSWPESGLLAQAAACLLLSSGENNACVSTNTLLKVFAAEQTARLNTLSKSKDELNAVLVARNLSLSKKTDPTGALRSQYEKLVKQTGFTQQRDNLLANLRLEMSLRNHYLTALQEKDPTWWKNEIRSLNIKIDTEKEQQKNLVYRRIKSFLGVACYSICNRSANQKNTNVLKQTLAVYQILEPENPDMFYYSAVLAHSEKNTVKEKGYLQKAKEKGYQGSLSMP